MSYGVVALLLIHLDARLGRWVPLADLSKDLGVPEDKLRDYCEQLQADRLIRVTRDHASGVITGAMTDPAGTCASSHPLESLG